MLIIKFSSIITKTSGNCFYIVNLYFPSQFVNAFGLAVLSYRPSSFSNVKINTNLWVLYTILVGLNLFSYLFPSCIIFVLPVKHIAAPSDQFVWILSVRSFVCLCACPVFIPFGSHVFLVVTRFVFCVVTSLMHAMLLPSMEDPYLKKQWCFFRNFCDRTLRLQMIWKRARNTTFYCNLLKAWKFQMGDFRVFRIIFNCKHSPPPNMKITWS